MKRLTLAALIGVLVSTPAPAATGWEVLQLHDEFGDPVSVAAVSDPVRSARPMGFPYEDVTARVYVTCGEIAGRHRARVWIRFSDANLTREVASYRLDQGPWVRATVRVGNDELSFSGYDPDLDDYGKSWSRRVLGALVSGDIFDIRVFWHGEGRVGFRWSLAGSSRAIQAVGCSDDLLSSPRAHG